jgi:hypothetical protein
MLTLAISRSAMCRPIVPACACGSTLVVAVAPAVLHAPELQRLQHVLLAAAHRVAARLADLGHREAVRRRQLSERRRLSEIRERLEHVLGHRLRDLLTCVARGVDSRPSSRSLKPCAARTSLTTCSATNSSRSRHVCAPCGLS